MTWIPFTPGIKMSPISGHVNPDEKKNKLMQVEMCRDQNVISLLDPEGIHTHPNMIQIFVFS